MGVGRIVLGVRGASAGGGGGRSGGGEAMQPVCRGEVV